MLVGGLQPVNRALCNITLCMHNFQKKLALVSLLNDGFTPKLFYFHLNGYQFILPG